MKRKENYGKMCPNPQFERKSYRFLCGEWKFAIGNINGYRPNFDKTIVVPYSYECKASGVGDERVHECVWYERTFLVDAHKGRLLLQFEAVDYEAEIYVNHKFAGRHAGGFTQFCLDITELSRQGENVLTVKVTDSLDKSQLRGKQRCKEKSYECWYVQTTGIWKPVWLEYAGDIYLKACEFHAKTDGVVEFSLHLSAPAAVRLAVKFGTEKVFEGTYSPKEELLKGKFVLPDPHLWSCAVPNLYTAEITVGEESPDIVDTYFGIREISVKEDGLYINGEREYQQMVLDQGYWPDTMLTAPDEDALLKDVTLIKRMGFNGVRKHQKVESNLFYYLCDRYGLYVWGEIPSPYRFDERMKEEFSRDCLEIVRQLKGHPSIVCWLLFNETWGVYNINESREEQRFVEEIYRAVRETDDRPIITNDGWSHLNSDILSLHEYEQDAGLFLKEYEKKDYVVSRKKINVNFYGRAFAEGYCYSGQPVMISEYGGIAIVGDSGWGYGDRALSVGEYETRVRKIVDSVKKLDYISGCCYTQFTDVQQEVNGLLTADRVPKLPIETVREIFGTNK